MAVNLSPPNPSELYPIAGVRLGITEAGVRKAGRKDLTVILLEAGSRDLSPLIHVPAGVAKLSGHPVYDWKFLSSPEPLTGDRGISCTTAQTDMAIPSHALRAAWVNCLSWLSSRSRRVAKASALSTAGVSATAGAASGTARGRGVPRLRPGYQYKQPSAQAALTSSTSAWVFSMSLLRRKG